MEELIPKRNMRVKVEVSDWKDAIRKAGELLVDDGKISTDYIENMISSVMTGRYQIPKSHSDPLNGIQILLPIRGFQ